MEFIVFYLLYSAVMDIKLNLLKLIIEKENMEFLNMELWADYSKE